MTSYSEKKHTVKIIKSKKLLNEHTGRTNDTHPNEINCECCLIIDVLVYTKPALLLLTVAFSVKHKPQPKWSPELARNKRGRLKGWLRVVGVGRVLSELVYRDLS